VTLNLEGVMINESISIHTFLTEGDAKLGNGTGSTVISIHTFLTEGDSMALIIKSRMQHFNPHLPHRR